MTNYGVFRDDFYNAACVLTESAAVTGPVATGVLVASSISGARDNAVSVGGTSQTYTTDTAANIIANIKSAIAAAYKANVGGFASSLGAQPPIDAGSFPNFFNFTWILEINTSATVTGVTLANGAGVTLAAISTLSPTALAAAGAANARFVCQITGPASITMTRVQ